MHGKKVGIGQLEVVDLSIFDTLKDDLITDIKKLKEEEGLTIYSCTGTPVDTIKLALDKILDRKPDIVLSGINHGSNASVSVIYSGTLGAAREGCINCIPSVGYTFFKFSRKHRNN